MRKHFLLFFLLLWGISPLCAQEPQGVSPNPQSAIRNPQSTRAVVVGISDYQDAAIPDLRFADKDAEAFANFLRSPAGGSLDNDHLKVLTNQNATAGRIAEALDDLLEQAAAGDQVIIYFSGHGDVERKTVSQPGFLLAWDAPSRVYMGGGTYSLAFLQEVVTTLSTQNLAKVTVITDACHAGKLSGSQIGGAQLTSANLARQYANEVKILSCQPNEFSLEGEQWGGGRGCFSYHLVDGLFGLADRNEDDLVTVGELDRYLEDKVTAEAAPQSQVPMLLGNKTERLARVNAAVLADLKKAKASGIPVFAATESRGFEDEVLAKVDSSIREMYRAFKLAVQEKRFFLPAGNSAEDYFAQLTGVEALVPLRGMMTRNYAAALQDDAQQVINIWLKADVRQLDCIGTTIKLEPLPSLLNRAADLLGKDHYMYNFLKSRQYLFEAINHTTHKNPDEEMGRACISLYKKSIEFEPQSPLPWYKMSEVYVYNMRMPDSAFYCVEQAMNIAPNWVLPYTSLSNSLIGVDNVKRAEEAYLKAAAIQPDHPYVINQYCIHQRAKGDLEAAIEAFKKYDAAGGPKYTCWHNDYGVILAELGRFKEAEEQYLLAYQLDSANTTVLNSLARLYHETKRFDKAEQAYLKILEMDSMVHVAWFNLGYLYKYTKRDLVNAKKAFLKASEIDPKRYFGWIQLGEVYGLLGEYQKAIQSYLTAHSLDTQNVFAYHYLGTIYTTMGEYEKSEHWLKRGIEKDTAELALWNQLGFNYVRAEQYLKAEPIFLKILSVNPKGVPPLNNLATIYKNTGRLTEAEETFQKAFEIDQNFLPTYTNYARFKDFTGDYEKAVETCQNCLKIDSTNTSCLEALATSYLLNRQSDEAEKAANRLLKVKPNSVQYQAILAQVYIRTDRFQEADAILNVLLQRDSNSVMAMQLKGFLNFRQNNLKEATAWYQKALSIDARHAMSLMGMAYIQIANKEEAAALVWVEKAIAAGAQYTVFRNNENLGLLKEKAAFNGMLKRAYPYQHEN